MVTISHSSHPDILILGAGWTSTFLLPILKQEKISYAATTTTGRDHTLKFCFDFDEENGCLSDESREQLKALPTAKTVLVTFPLRGEGKSKALVAEYIGSRDELQGKVFGGVQFIQLGSSGIFTPGEPTLNQKTAKTAEECWITRNSPYDRTNARAIAEDELLGLGGCVLNLSGLWGGERMVKHWIDRVANTKEQLAGKKALHMIHGKDVARGIVAVHKKFDSARGQRFILTDLFVYDWWALILGFAGEVDEDNGNDDRVDKQIKWVGELMEENSLRGLPRSVELLGRAYDSTEFWRTFGIVPVRARV